MPVYKDKKRNTWYVSIDYTDTLGEHHKHKKRGFDSRQLALDYEAAYRLQDKTATQRITFKQLYVDFIEYKQDRVKPRSLKDYQNVAKKQLLPFFGNMIVKKINIAIVEDFQKKLLELNYSNNYNETIQTVLSMIFKHAVRRNIIATSPFDYIEYVKHKNKKSDHKLKFWTYEEFMKFKSVIDDNDCRCLFDTLYYTGMRISELQSRRWKDINWNTNDLYIHDNYDQKNNDITVSPKNGTNRTIVLNKIVLKELKEKYNRDKCIDGFNDESFIFGTYKVLSQKTYTRLKDKYINMYNNSHDDKLNRIVLHDFRHSHVSLLINNGVDSFTISERLGHSKEMVERVYGHLFPSKRKAVLDILDNL